MKRVLFVAAMLAALTATAYAAMEAGAIDPMIKVRPFQKPEFSSQATLYAAKNEWEPFQVVIYNNTQGDLTSVTATLDQLNGPNEFVIDAIDLYREHYVNVPHPSAKPGNMDDIGLWPDALIPFTDRYFGEVRSGAPFDVPDTESRVIWTDIYVPENAPAGEYSGTMIVSATGESQIEIPVNLTVFDFALPNKASLVSTYGYSCGGAYSAHQANGGIVEMNELNRYYWAEALEHRMTLSDPSCNSLPWYYDEENDIVVFDWSTFDAELSDVLSGTFYLTRPGTQFTTFRLPGQVSDWHTNVRFWQAFLAHFQEHGWADKLFLYLPDEPTPEEYPLLISIAQNLHEADPSLRALATEQFEEALAGAIDIWCPDEPLFSDWSPLPPHPSDYPPRQSMGEEVWWYNCMSAQFGVDFSDHFVDSPGLSLRIWPWLTRRYNFTGLLYWHTLYLYSQDLWENPYAEQFFCNGDGTMFYYGVPSKIGGTHDIPIPSIRLKMYREGMEDYEYFKILDDLGYKDFVQQEVERRAFRTYQWEKDPAKLQQSRLRLAYKILGTLDETPPAVPGNFALTPQDKSIKITWSAPPDEDLDHYEIYLSRYSGERTLVGEPHAGVIALTVDGLENGKPYYSFMVAVDNSGNISEPTVELSATPEAGTLKLFRFNPFPSHQLSLIAHWLGAKILQKKGGGQ